MAIKRSAASPKHLILFVGLVLHGCGGGGGNGGGNQGAGPIQDRTPDSFLFQQATADTPGAEVESNSIVISGTNTASQVSVVNAEYRIDQGAYTSQAGQISTGQTLNLRVIAPSFGQSVTATLTIGGVSAEFKVTTLNPDAALERVSNLSCLAPDYPDSSSAQLELEAAFANLPALTGLVGLQQAPGDSSRWYALLQSGQVYWFENQPSASALHLFIDLSAQVQNSGERGLLGMAFDPQYSSNGRLYLSYVNHADESILSRVIFQGSEPIDTSAEQVLLNLPQPASNHNGGHIAFGPDGFLYLGFGDGGGAGDTFGNGQNTQSLHAALLRLDVSGAGGYNIPADNPFVTNPKVRNEIYAYGLRNPWRWSFDSQSGALWLGDVGQNAIEEIDLVEAGDNLGWPIMEGSSCYNAANCDSTGLKLPVSEYNHQSGGCSVTGGYVYRGQRIPALQGHFIFGDYCSGVVRSVVPAAQASFNTQVLLDSGLTVASFAQGSDGEVLVLNYSGAAGAAVYRFRDSGSGSGQVPERLSETGCFTSTANKTPVAAAVPYEVSAELWADGAQKARLFAIPDNHLIGFKADGDFDFPPGSVLIKHFIHQGRYLETRLLMHHLSGWAGYSYRWLDDQSDALLVAGDEPTSISSGGLTHTIPSRAQCFECHTQAAGTILGLEARQLDSGFDYSGTSENQLLALTQAGFLTGDPVSLGLAPLTEPSDTTASLAQRARSYLHANCSICHRPGAPSPSMDLRYATPLSQTMSCDAAPNCGDLGIVNARIIAPGDANRSVLTARMLSLDGQVRMPPLASHSVDQEGLALIEQWINSLIDCDE